MGAWILLCIYIRYFWIFNFYFSFNHRFYGGWAAPHIFFLGAAGVVQFGGLRIGGLSGIYKKYEYNTGAVGAGMVGDVAEIWQDCGINMAEI